MTRNGTALGVTLAATPAEDRLYSRSGSGSSGAGRLLAGTSEIAFGRSGPFVARRQVGVLLRLEQVHATREEHPMYARLISMSGAVADVRERAIQTIHETVIPTLRQQAGYAGYIGLFDADNRRARAVLLWESREAAEAGEAALADFRAQVIGGLGMTFESADLYEAPVVELE